MNVSRSLIAMVGASLLLAGGAFANESKGSLNLFETVTVQGKTLSAGKYKVEWNGTGSSVNVNILRGKNVVATVPATVVPETSENQGDGYQTTDAGNGSKALQDIFFGGKKFQLHLAQNGEANSSSPSGS